MSCAERRYAPGPRCARGRGRNVTLTLRRVRRNDHRAVFDRRRSHRRCAVPAEVRAAKAVLTAARAAPRCDEGARQRGEQRQDRSAVYAPKNDVAMSRMAPTMPVATPAPLPGCGEVGSSLASPIAAAIKLSSDIAAQPSTVPEKIAVQLTRMRP